MPVRTAKYWSARTRLPDDLLAEDGVGVAAGCGAFSAGEFAQHAHAEAGAGEGLPHQQSGAAVRADGPAARTSSLKRHAQRLDHRPQSRMSFGSPPTLWWLLMVAALLAAGFDHVGIDRALREDSSHPRSSSWLLSSKTRTNSAPMILRFVLRIGDALERREEALCRVDADKVDGRACGRRSFDLRRPHFCASGRGRRRCRCSWPRMAFAIAAPQQTEESTPPDSASSTCAPEPTCSRTELDQLLCSVDPARSSSRRHAPQTVIEEVADASRVPVYGVDSHLRVELHAVELPRRAGHRCSSGRRLCAPRR